MFSHRLMETPDSAERFVVLLARHERMLAAYVLTLVPNAVDADDVLQDAKVVMWRHFHQFQAHTNFGAWARKILFHQVLAYRKRRHRDRLQFSDQFLQAVAEEMDHSAHHLEQRQRALDECLARLPKQQHKLLHSRYHEQCSIEQLSSDTQKSPTALYAVLSRLRQILRECVDRNLTQEEASEHES